MSWMFPQVDRPLRVISKKLGKVIGHCPSCGLVFGVEEKGLDCGRCGEVYKETKQTTKENPHC